MTGSKDLDVAYVSLMQPDRRMDKSAGKAGENLTIGFFIMAVSNSLLVVNHLKFLQRGPFYIFM